MSIAVLSDQVSKEFDKDVRAHGGDNFLWEIHDFLENTANGQELMDNATDWDSAWDALEEYLIGYFIPMSLSGNDEALKEIVVDAQFLGAQVPESALNLNFGEAMIAIVTPFISDYILPTPQAKWAVKYITNIANYGWDKYWEDKKEED